MPKLLTLFGVKIIGAVTTIGTATISSFEVVFFCKDTVSLRGKVKIFFYG